LKSMINAKRLDIFGLVQAFYTTYLYTTIMKLNVNTRNKSTNVYTYQLNCIIGNNLLGT